MILFPSEPFDPRQIDGAFAAEQQAAEAAGLPWQLVDHTAVTQGRVERALASIRTPADRAVYRGWMLTPAQYAAMHRALADRGVTLLNAPEAYRTCHHLPESYPLLEGHTPRSVWMPLDGPPDRDQLRALFAPFGDDPVVIKDYVKSQKHLWTEACFIPHANDFDHVERVVARFLELQGEDLAVGLVVRAFAPLRIVGAHPQSGMPLAAEVRIFWLEATPLLVHRYWADLVPPDATPPLADLAPLAARIPSRFFTMDVAQRDDGTWTIVELGDAQVSGLPTNDLAPAFYRDLAAKLGDA